MFSILSVCTLGWQISYDYSLDKFMNPNNHSPAANLPVPKQQYGLTLGYQSGAAFEPVHDTIEDDASGFDPLRIFWFIIHYRWLITAFLIAGFVSGIVFTFLQTPMYRASTKIEIQAASAKIIQDLEVLSQGDDARIFNTAKVKMLSRDLARRVIFKLNLTDKQEFLAPTASFSLTNLLKQAIGSSNQADVMNLPQKQREEKAIKIIRRNISINLIRGTSILSVQFSHANPIFAAKIANQLVGSFINQNVDKKSETSDLARQFIEEQVRETKKKLQESEKRLVAYAQQAGITITGDDVSLISANIAEINKALSEAIQQRLTEERFNQQIKDGESSSLPEVFASESIQTTKQKIAELSATYQEKLGTLKPGFPEMRRLNAQIRELKKQVNFEIVAIAKSVRIRYKQILEKEKALKRELVGLEQDQSAFQKKNIKYTIFKREVDSNRKQFDSLISKLSEIGIGSELKTSNISIIENAIQPNSPFSPRRLLNLAAALGLFSALAVATIYILELMNNTFSVPDQLESELQIPVLGITPKVAEEEIAEGFNTPTSPLSEAHRTLRTSLQFTGVGDKLRTILVTSSEMSEGKTTTAFKLASDFAALGRKVLVIDADMRKPRMHRVFGTDNAFGLSNLLTNVIRSNNVTDLFRTTNNPNITLLTSGTIPPNPADILSSQKMGLTLHYCSKKFDLVIVDSPPVMGLSDAPILARQLDATLLVVSSKQVTRKSAKNALSRLKSAGANVVGCAFTKFAVDQLDYNYAYRYMQYNYYAYEDSENANKQLENHGANNNTSKPSRAAGYVSALIDRVSGRTG